jgi:phage I-like protein
MSVQDFIDAVDTAKPIDPPANKSAPKPTSASVRANFAALKNAVQGLHDEIDGLSGSAIETGVYVPVVMGGFVDDLVTMNSGHKVPRLVCMNDGRVVMCELGENL